MIAHVTLGANDLDAARRFYSAILGPLGYQLSEFSEGLCYALGPVERGGQYVFVQAPFDGRPASVGNGTMVSFDVQNQAQVRALHAAGLAAGGTDEGAPGFRAAYSAGFYVAYLRDPQGNKVSLFADNPDEPTRDDPPSA